MKTAADVLKFWFEDHGPPDWFAARPEFDALIVSEFTATHDAAARGELWRWRTTSLGRLAEIIVLDQFSRQIYRGEGRAFATDPMTLVLAQEAVAGGHHNFLPMPHRMFMLLPYSHSESLEVQAESVRLHTVFADEEMMKHVNGHAECIRRFGRFPKRNKALARESTAEEAEYIASKDGMY